MKVRHKRTGMIIAPVKEYDSFYLFNCQPGPCATGFEDARFALPKSDYEPVPEPRWVDVTAACQLGRNDLVFHGDKVVVSPDRSGYRLVKVQVVMRDDLSQHGDTDYPGFPGFRSAFLIEKQEPA